MEALVDDVVPPDVLVVVPLDVLAGAAYDEDIAYVGALGERLVDGRLERRGRTATVAAVGGDDDPRVAVEDARRQGVRGEAAEDDRVRCAEPGAGEHRDDRLGDHRHVDRDPVAGLDAEVDQRVGGLGDLVLHLRERDVAGVVGRFADPVERHLVAVAGLDVAVDAVVGRVELAADEPLGERRVGPVEHVRERGVPADPLGLLGPVAQPVGLGLVVRARGRIGVGGEVRRRVEVSGFVREIADRVVSHGGS